MNLVKIFERNIQFYRLKYRLKITVTITTQKKYKTKKCLLIQFQRFVQRVMPIAAAVDVVDSIALTPPTDYK